MLSLLLLLPACAGGGEPLTDSARQANELLVPPSAASPTRVAPMEDVPAEAAPGYDPVLVEASFGDTDTGLAKWSSVTPAGEFGLAQAAPAEPTAATPPPADDDLETLAKKTNNPISDAWLLITQNDYTLLGGKAVDGYEALNVTKFQPVLSAPLFGGSWNFVVRPVLQLTSAPIDKDVGDLFGVSPDGIVADDRLRRIAEDPFGRTTGLGDTVLLTLVGPNTDDGWIFAGGISQIFPTASEDVLGQEKWQVGPAALVARLGSDYGGFGIEHFNLGLLAQQWWSYAGDSDRENTDQADIQYFLNWKQNPTRLIGMTPNISINWDADGNLDDKIAFPIGIGMIDLFKVGPLPVRWGVEAQYYLTGADAVRREFNFRFFVAPIIPNLLK